MGKKILVFDDDNTLLDVLNIVLCEGGYEIQTSDSTQDIIEKVSIFNPDIILMDNYIPNIGGAAAIKMLKSDKRFDHIKIILITSSVNIISLKNTSGADDYLRKPFDLSLMEEKISNSFLYS